MIAIGLDAVVLTVVLAFMNKGETEGFGKVLMGVVLMTLLNIGLGFADVRLELGLLTLVFMFALDGMLLRAWFGLTWPKALGAVAILFAIKIPLMLLFQRGE